MQLMNYHVCSIVGDGLTEATAFRPSIADDGVDFHVSALPTKPDGSPDSTWCLTKSSSNRNTLDARKMAVLPPQAAQTAQDALDSIIIEMGITPDIKRPEYAAALAMLNRDYT